MKKRVLTITCALSLLLAIVLLSGCNTGYSESEMESIKQQAYKEGFDDGYWIGAEEQQALDYEELLIDGASIQTVEDKVYSRYGMTPHEAFQIYDEYTYDGASSGYTWTEYQEALEVMYYTASIFPYDY